MGGQRGFDPKLSYRIILCCKAYKQQNLVKLFVKDIVAPLWQGAKGKFGGAMPPFAPLKNAYDHKHSVLQRYVQKLI